jgi:hypothetical protein
MVTFYSSLIFIAFYPGRYITKFGNSVHTPYPVGIDISKTGDVLVGDSHGNHFHIVVFTINGKLLQDYRCTAHKVQM